jgi:HAD superfamily hydrolase (TIGR01549 family)
VSDYLGGGYEDKLWSFFCQGQLAIDELLKEIGRESEKIALVDLYRNHKPDVHLYKGVLEMLRHLRERNIRIGIITDGRVEGQRNKIEALGLNVLVDDIIITDELGGIQFRKPCDIAFRILQTRWRLNSTEIIYVGDNPEKDFQAPQQLGMRSVLLANKDSLYFNDNDLFEGSYIKIIQGIDELELMWENKDD